MPANDRGEDLEVLDDARPWIRTGIAILIFVGSAASGANRDVPSCYSVADSFLGRLERDLKGEK